MARRNVPIFASALLVGCLSAATATAQYAPWEKWHLENHVPGVGLNAFKVFIHNQSPFHIQVEVMWYQWNSNASHLAVVGGYQPFTSVYYNFAPGEKAYIGNTQGRNIYFKARDVNGQAIWQSPSGGYIATDMGSRFCEYTQNFTYNR